MNLAVRSYVALGDSFTCGHEPGVRRWPDAVAAHLGAGVRYENLGEVGATSADVEAHQLPRAQELQPDLVSVVCGANDVLRDIRPDPVEYALRLGRIIDLLAPAVVVTGTYPPFTDFVGFRARTRARVEWGMHFVNAAIRRVSHEHGALLVEGFHRPGASRGDFAEDGFHPSSAGHRRTAQEVLTVLRERLARAEALSA